MSGSPTHTPASACRQGERIGTLAWNTHRHLECWYGIMGIGAVCHTLNPRLFDADLEYIINDAEVGAAGGCVAGGRGIA